MQIRQFYLGCLSQASYLIGSNGDAAVIDPRRDVDEYLEFAREHGLQIRHVLETHFHADFVSGHRELAARTGAKLYFGRRARPGYRVEHLSDGDEVRVGSVVLRALETPGHTPESLCFLAMEAGEPRALFTGDTLFVGEVGRPDLMGIDLPAEEMAGQLYDSLHGKILTLPDDVEVWPGHGPGSACGRNIGPETRSTVGKERKLNYALNLSGRDEFIRVVAGDLPGAPRYFSHDARLNREGPGDLDQALAGLKPIAAADARRMTDEGSALVLDTRGVPAYGAGHVPGSIHVGIDGRYASWVGTVLDPSTPLLLLADPGREREAAMRLARVGYENIVGYLEGGIDSWAAAGQPVRRLEQIEPAEARRRLEAGEITLLDVRGGGEWSDGHAAGARHRPLPELADGDGSTTGGQAVAVVCGSGYRSSIACSLLESQGYPGELMNVSGGMGAWREAGLPEDRPGR